MRLRAARPDSAYASRTGLNCSHRYGAWSPSGSGKRMHARPLGSLGTNSIPVRFGRHDNTVTTPLESDQAASSSASSPFSPDAIAHCRSMRPVSAISSLRRTCPGTLTDLSVAPTRTRLGSKPNSVSALLPGGQFQSDRLPQMHRRRQKEPATRGDHYNGIPAGARRRSPRPRRPWEMMTPIILAVQVSALSCGTL